MHLIPNLYQYILLSWIEEKVKVYIVFDLHARPTVPLLIFTLKEYLLGAANIVENSDKEKYLYSGYGIAFDGKGELSFANDYVRNVIIFGVDNSSSSHADSLKNIFLI